MHKVVIYFSNGTIMNSAPLNTAEAQEFAKSFEDHEDVAIVDLTQTYTVEEAKQYFKTAAAQWKHMAERNRKVIGFDPELDKIALTIANEFMSVAH